MTKEELLEAIRKEIIETGIDDYPSQTRYSEKSSRETSPSYTTAKKMLNMSWTEIVDSLGFEYTEKKQELHSKNASQPRGKRSKPSPLKGKKRGPIGSKWTRMDRVGLAKKIKQAVKENKIQTIEEYKKFVKQSNGEYPSYNFVHYYFGNFSEIMKKDVRRW